MTIHWDGEPLFECPHCKTTDTVYASGNPDAKGLIIAEFPGNEEVKYGRPMVGRMGTVLNMELHKVGLDIKSFRLCNLWIHLKNKNEDCYKYGAELMMHETKGRKAILLLGSDVCEYFLHRGIMEVSGMQVEPPLLKGKIVVASVNPANVFSGGVGEIRLAINRFASLTEDIL